jgi:hypothetical protein
VGGGSKPSPHQFGADSGTSQAHLIHAASGLMVTSYPDPRARVAPRLRFRPGSDLSRRAQMAAQAGDVGDVTESAGEEPAGG